MCDCASCDKIRKRESKASIPGIGREFLLTPGKCISIDLYIDSFGCVVKRGDCA